MNSEIVHKLSKYLVQGIIIYLFFKFVPKDPMSDNEILLITSIIILAYAIIENLYGLFYKQDDVLTHSQCESKCSLKESMTSLPPVVQENNLVNDKLSELDKKLQQLEADRKAFDEQMSKLSVSSESNSQQVTSQGVTKNSDGSYTIIPVENKSAQAVGSRSLDGVMSANDELALASNYVDFTVFPPGNDTFVSGSSYLPPAQWYPVPPRPPACVTEKVCPVCPIYTEGTSVDLQEWDNSRRLTPPDNINTDFVMGKLNSGR